MKKDLSIIKLNTINLNDQYNINEQHQLIQKQKFTRFEKTIIQKNFGRYIPEQARPCSATQIKQLTQVKSSTQLSKLNFQLVQINKRTQISREIQRKFLNIESYKINYHIWNKRSQNIKTHIDNSQRQTKQSLASRFFNTKKIMNSNINNSRTQKKQKLVKMMLIQTKCKINLNPVLW
ncbi:unnamed protein product [Paramecium sonneborni]|uniref:Uncharacterized protein n=1 Tax=Paramecium sonneborni TaxID=65129 RepID=A0A8S1RT21_9CILI|nr:unnamed protein product [Paramecium sonneborni]